MMLSPETIEAIEKFLAEPLPKDFDGALPFGYNQLCFYFALHKFPKIIWSDPKEAFRMCRYKEIQEHLYEKSTEYVKQYMNERFGQVRFKVVGATSDPDAHTMTVHMLTNETGYRMATTPPKGAK
jgi:hypothetical protein